MLSQSALFGGGPNVIGVWMYHREYVLYSRVFGGDGLDQLAPR